MYLDSMVKVTKLKYPDGSQPKGLTGSQAKDAMRHDPAIRIKSKGRLSNGNIR